MYVWLPLPANLSDLYLMKLFPLLTFMISLAATVVAQPGTAPNRLLVVSGGGARGAWGAGLANYLDSTGKRYAHIVGTSTGSLMAPLILLRKFSELNLAYTSTTQKKIFNINPFKADGNIRILNALCRINKPSLGTTENLKTLIKTFVSPADYAQIRNSQGLDFTVSLVNFRTLQPAYQSASQNPDYEQMINWIWASANEPVFMSPYRKMNADGTEDFWVDGGVRNPIPIRQGLQIALDRGYSTIDVIVNSALSADEPTATWPDKRPSLFKSLTRTIATFSSGTREMNITIGKLLTRLANLQPDPQLVSTAVQPVATANKTSLTLTLYFMPDELYKLIPNELNFDPATMTTLLNAGKQGQYVMQPTILQRVPGVTAQSTEGTYSFQLSRAAVAQLLNDLNK
jgi:predicted acylesterase/phospholipase RssA